MKILSTPHFSEVKSTIYRPTDTWASQKPFLLCSHRTSFFPLLGGRGTKIRKRSENSKYVAWPRELGATSLCSCAPALHRHGLLLSSLTMAVRPWNTMQSCEVDRHLFPHLQESLAQPHTLSSTACSVQGDAVPVAWRDWRDGVAALSGAGP